MNVAVQNVIELCAGYAGIGLGIRLAVPDAVTRVYVEREISAARILAARIEDGSLHPADIWTDLKTFDGRPYRGQIDILAAGYPCQPFSCAGKQLAEKDPRHLWPEVARIIREVQPRRVFLENVDAHLRLGFREVAAELGRMGYRIAAGLFTAAEVGAPHQRRRLFILGNAAGVNEGHLARQESPQPRRGRDSVLPLFPPRKDDRKAWARMLLQHPDLEPAVCRAFDGATYRLDRWRALGNGVVPLVAAHAYRTLDAALAASGVADLEKAA